MPSFFEVDVNCPSCFNEVLQALASTDGVDLVEGDIASGCIAVTHRVDEAALGSIIHDVGRTVEFAGNGEYVMTEPRTSTAHSCAHHSDSGIAPPAQTERARLSAQSTLGEIVTADPTLARELECLGLDYCCGGAATLADACADQGLDPDSVIDELTKRHTDEHPPAWSTMSVEQLVDHIESTHHRYLWDELPRLTTLFDKVVAAHGANHPELVETRRCFDEIRTDLEPHMMKEERILFPMIRQLSSGNQVLDAGPGSVRGPISVMLREHDLVGAALAELRVLADGYRAPSDGCASYAALFDGLADLEADTHMHIHKENNLLFPAVVELEQQLVT